MSAHGTYEHVDGRPAVRFVRELSHPPERVWEVVTQPQELARWFPCAVELELRLGGPMRFTFGPDFALDGEVLECEPPRRFAFRWGQDHVGMTIEPHGEGSRLTFVHVLFEEGEDAAAKTAAGWHLCLDAIGSPGPAPAGDSPAWRERYAEYQAAGFPSGAAIASG